MERTVYVTDLDGTLLNNNIEISDNSARIINGLINQGVLFTCATARSFASAGKIINKLDLKLPIAVYNGAVLVNPHDGGIIECCVMDKEEAVTVLVKLLSISLYPLVYSMIDGRERVSWVQGHESPGVKGYLESRKNDRRLRAVLKYSDLFDGDIFYITVIGTKKDADVFENLFKSEQNGHIYYHVLEDVYNKGEYWLEISRKDATKEYAVRKLKEYANAKRVVCFGDNVNDMPMFKASDESYAVSNAEQRLKEIATGVIRSNNEDGVAVFLSGMDGRLLGL